MPAKLLYDALTLPLSAWGRHKARAKTLSYQYPVVKYKITGCNPSPLKVFKQKTTTKNKKTTMFYSPAHLIAGFLPVME